jgi:2,3-bisphosphoglycerate-independent phosphoglycerate mutase
VSGRAVPIVLIVIDGLGDRQHAELDDLTPLEAAETPAFDAIAAAGTCGRMWPLGPGRAPSTPLAHWVMFGMEAALFPGRGLLEALGEGAPPRPGEVVCRANFVAATPLDGALMIDERPDPRSGPDVNADVDLDADLPGGVRARFMHTGSAQGLLYLGASGALSAEVTDADPLRVNEVVRRVLPYAEAARPEAAGRTADALNAWMLEARRRLAGRALDTALVKWAGSEYRGASFTDRTGLRGATLARGALLPGLGAAAGLGAPSEPEGPDQDVTLGMDLQTALGLLDDGLDFVHVHTKWTDTAGHKKSPVRKREVIELLDAAVALHVEALLASGAVVCLTTDHQTPSSGPLYHSGGSVPIAIAGGVAGRDEVARFSERGCGTGALGSIRGDDLMPLLLDCADRSAFLAERYTGEPCMGTAAADRVVPLAPEDTA